MLGTEREKVLDEIVEEAHRAMAEILSEGPECRSLPQPQGILP